MTTSTRFPIIHTPCCHSPSGVARCIDLEWLIEHNLAEWSQHWADLASSRWCHGAAKISAADTPIADTLRAAGIAYVFTTRLS